MLRYALRRVLLLIPVMALISILSFALLVSLPGDPLDMLVLGDPGVTQADIAHLKDLYGLNDPFPVRYAKWIAQVAQGNLGYSRTYHIPTVELLEPRIENTLLLTGLALALSLLVSLPVGVLSAVRPYSIADYAGTLMAFIGYALPSFWLGLLLIIVFGVNLGWLPAGGLVSFDAPSDTLAALVDRGRYLILPVIVLALGSMAIWTRYMRSSLLEVIRLDYVQTARSKGLAENSVVYGHALRNALIPLVTLFANTVPALLGGSVVVETVFSYPGMGKLLYDSVLGNDFSVSMAILMMLSVLGVLFNLAADLMYGLLDPRIRYQ